MSKLLRERLPQSIDAVIAAIIPGREKKGWCKILMTIAPGIDMVEVPGKDEPCFSLEGAEIESKPSPGLQAKREARNVKGAAAPGKGAKGKEMMNTGMMGKGNPSKGVMGKGMPSKGVMGEGMPNPFVQRSMGKQMPSKGVMGKGMPSKGVMGKGMPSKGMGEGLGTWGGDRTKYNPAQKRPLASRTGKGEGGVLDEFGEPAVKRTRISQHDLPQGFPEGFDFSHGEVIIATVLEELNFAPEGYLPGSRLSKALSERIPEEISSLHQTLQAEMQALQEDSSIGQYVDRPLKGWLKRILQEEDGIKSVNVNGINEPCFALA